MRPRDILSEFVIHTKYARYVGNRRESWSEIVARVFDMHRERFFEFKESLDIAEDFVRNKLVMPSMRSIQFAGDAILKKHERMFNCSYLPIDGMEDITDLFALCMMGVGVGFSTYTSIPVRNPRMTRVKHLVDDSVEGWVDALRSLLNAYSGGFDVVFDYSQVRPKGAFIKGISSSAPGYEVLEIGLERIRKILHDSLYLRTVDIFDICTILGDIATCGGTRRSALITFFSPDDALMMNAKKGPFWETHPWRSRANISATFLRSTPKDVIHKYLLDNLGSETGEPGLFLTNNKAWHTNPCAEIALQPYSFCNLTSINATCLKDRSLFLTACKTAAFLGTLQACYTDFKLVNKQFEQNAIKERLLGVSITGLAEFNLADVSDLLREGSETCRETNFVYSRALGINPAHRITCIKPEGSTSAVMGTSSGVHAEESDFYIRNIRIGHQRGIVDYLKSINYPLLQQDVYNPNDVVVGVPIRARGKTIEHQSSFDLVDDICTLNEHWIDPGHRRGFNKHNVSTTLRVKQEDVKELARYLIDKIDNYTAVAYLPHSDVVYPQAPFQSITEEEYKAIKLPDIDFSKIKETFKNDEFLNTAACEGGRCDLGTHRAEGI